MTLLVSKQGLKVSILIIFSQNPKITEKLEAQYN